MNQLQHTILLDSGVFYLDKRPLLKTSPMLGKLGVTHKCLLVRLHDSATVISSKLHSLGGQQSWGIGCPA